MGLLQHLECIILQSKDILCWKVVVQLALKKIVEVHSWLSKDVVFTEKELEARGWNFAYDLQTWDIFGHSSPKDIILFNLTGGILRTIDNGPKSNKWMKELKQTKASYRNVLPF